MEKSEVIKLLHHKQQDNYEAWRGKGMKLC